MRSSNKDTSLQLYRASENSAAGLEHPGGSSADRGARWSANTTIVSGETATGRDGMPGCASESVFRTR